MHTCDKGERLCRTCAEQLVQVPQNPAQNETARTGPARVQHGVDLARARGQPGRALRLVVGPADGFGRLRCPADPHKVKKSQLGGLLQIAGGCDL